MAQLASPSTQRSGALDVFRFVAVLMVFFVHYTDTYNYIYKIVPQNLKWNFITRYFSIAILMFFMLSGYVITLSSMKKGIREFITTRISKLYPLFWLSCIVAFLLPRIIPHHTYLSLSHFKLFLANLTMAPQLWGYDTINPVFWTMLIELVFYFFIAIVILFKLWNRILLIISLLLVYSFIYNLKGVQSVNMFIPTFAAGMLMYFIKINYASRCKLYTLLIINYACAIAGCKTVVDGLNTFYNNPQAVNIWGIYIIFTVTYILFYWLTVKGAFEKGNRLTLTLGEISYPFYLFHIYFFYLYWYFRNTQEDLLLLGILIMVLITSWLLNVIIEKPFSKLTARILNSFHPYQFFKKRFN